MLAWLDCWIQAVLPEWSCGIWIFPLLHFLLYTKMLRKLSQIPPNFQTWFSDFITLLVKKGAVWLLQPAGIWSLVSMGFCNLLLEASPSWWDTCCSPGAEAGGKGLETFCFFDIKMALYAWGGLFSLVYVVCFTYSSQGCFNLISALCQMADKILRLLFQSISYVLICVWLFVIPWTVVHQALPMGFSRQEYWSG